MPGSSPDARHDIVADDTLDTPDGITTVVVDGHTVSTSSRTTDGVASTLPATSIALTVTVCMPSVVAFTTTAGPLIKPTPTATPSNDTAYPLTTSDDDTPSTSSDEFVAVTDNNGTANTGVNAVFTTTDVFGGAVSRLQLSR
jgi:hypothetical protein